MKRVVPEYVVLHIISKKNSMLGRSAIEYITYMLHVLYPDDTPNDFRNDYFGPFSPSTKAAIYNLIAYGFAYEFKKPNRDVEDVYRYRLTDDGRKLRKEQIAEGYGTMAKRIRKTVKTVKKICGNDIHAMRFAAIKHRYGDSTYAVLGATPESYKKEYGFVVSDKQIKDGKALWEWLTYNA